jgi:hypothetical protein
MWLMVSFGLVLTTMAWTRCVASHIPSSPTQAYKAYLANEIEFQIDSSFASFLLWSILQCFYVVEQY